MMKAPVMNRKLLVLLGPVAALVMFAGTVMMASSLMSREYKMPTGPLPRPWTRRPAPREWPTRRPRRPNRPRTSPTRRRSTGGFPLVGSRVAIWMVAQLHLLFAAFVLAVPIFALIVEAIGYKTGDLRYDRLATSSRSSSPSPSR